MAYKNMEDRRAYHSEYMRERRKWFKEHKCCTECGEQDAYTLGGRSMCYECNKKRRIYQGYTSDIDSLSFSKMRKDRKDYNKIPREQFIKRGMCYLCGKPVKEGYKVCEKHYQHMLDIRKKQKENGQDETIRKAINERWLLQKAKKEYKNMAKCSHQNTL